MTRSKIRTSGADGLTLSSTSLTVADGLTLSDGNVTLASGHGIDFAATSDVSGMLNELLDDYEEGTFTPAADFASASPSAGATVGQGVYTKIGRLVNIQARLVNINVTGSSGDIKITGLPFTSLADSGDGSVTLFSGTCKMGSVNVASGSYCVSEIIDNVNHARVMECTDNVGTDVLNTANLNHGASDLHLNLTYPVQ